MLPLLQLAYFQLNPDGTSFELEPSCLDPYTTTDLTGRATWFTCVEPGQVRRRWNQSVRIRFSREGVSPGNVLCMNMPAVPDYIISDIIGELVEINRNLGHENLMEFQEAVV